MRYARFGFIFADMESLRMFADVKIGIGEYKSIQRRLTFVATVAR